MGGGIQKSKELVDKKIIGKINLGNAIFAFPGVQSYHPNPEPWFAKKEGGPVIDMGPYYLTALVNLLGPAKKVTGSIVNGVKRRIIGIGPRKNKSFKVECPTTYLSTITFENGTIIRLTLSFDVIAHQRNHIELYGDKGSMIVPDPNMFGGSVYICKNLGDPWKEYKTNKMPLGKINIRSQSSRANEASTNANYRGAGLAEMAYSIENKKINKCNGELSLHVLDIIQSTMKACTSGVSQLIKTSCQKPRPFLFKEIKKILK
ncbi:Gfo/Idh/MocA family protein [Candidatus Pelagibacter bacterium nBUS_25]|uniref:Gfo/Idh/MocA family protein n=1 Tax=Candidatus Pelagibacter bacterium nBUS_25 TaxID=3374187 RepID=UPI003EBA8DB3